MENCCNWMGPWMMVFMGLGTIALVLFIVWLIIQIKKSK